MMQALMIPVLSAHRTLQPIRKSIQPERNAPKRGGIWDLSQSPSMIAADWTLWVPLQWIASTSPISRQTKRKPLLLCLSQFVGRSTLDPGPNTHFSGLKWCILNAKKDSKKPIWLEPLLHPSKGKLLSWLDWSLYVCVYAHACANLIWW